MAEEEEVAVADETVEEETTPAEGFVTAAAAEEEEDFVAVGGATEIKLFGKWSFDDIEVRDISLVVRENFYTCRTRTKRPAEPLPCLPKDVCLTILSFRFCPFLLISPWLVMPTGLHCLQG